jgi:outer membrane protein OmpA-like peptidoglycan-associated protein
VTNPSTLNVGGLGDLRLVPKVRILRSQDQFVDLAIIPSFTVPTNIPSRSYIGEKGFTFAPELAISKAIGGLRMAGNLGWRLRDQTQFLDLDVNQELDYRAGIGYRFAQSFSLPLEIDLTANGATNILKPFQNFNSNPLEALGTVTYDINTAWSAYVGGGVGLFQGFGTPDLRLFAGVRWNPTDGDKDGDGIPDSLDKCPEEPEDKDGFEDSDGCPDPDNDKDGIPDVSDACPNEAGIPELQGCPERDTDGDGIKDSDDHCPGLPGPKENQGCPYADKDGDGILDADDKCPTVPGLKQFQGCPDSDGDGIPDAQDACPNNAGPPAFQGCPDRDHDGIPDNVDKCPDEPETINGFEDDDGCPDAGATKVKVTGSRVEILDKVYFDFNKATIQTRSFNLLDQVSSILRAHPEVTKIRVEGHTDAIGAADFNMTLSQARAESVRQYLIDHKVPAERLDAKGFGKTRPVATNATDAGREKNRRVEFVIVEMDGKPVENVDKLETHTPAH